jgi:hypothetical protein
MCTCTALCGRGRCAVAASNSVQYGHQAPPYPARGEGAQGEGEGMGRDEQQGGHHGDDQVP